MGQSILVAYATKNGSTAEVSQAIGNELANNGAEVDVRPIKEIDNLNGYDAVIIGGPMIFGWHPAAVSFLEQHQADLSRMPVACFLTGLSLTVTGADVLDGIPVYCDPSLAKRPKNEGRLSFRERYTQVSNYLRPLLKSAPLVEPVSVGIFNGALNSSRLKLIARLFVRLVIGAQDGDFCNWDAIRSWAASLNVSGIQASIAA